MQKKFIVTALSLIAATMIGGTANAFDLGALGSVMSKGSASSQSSVTPESIVKEYALGSQSVLEGHQYMLSALGFKEKAAQAALLVKKVTEDPSTSADEDKITFTTESTKLIQEKLNSKDCSLTDQGKEEFGKSMLNLGKGLIAYKAMTSDVTNFKPGISSIGGAAVAAVSIVKSIPEDTNNLFSLLSNAVKFAQSNEIPVPKDTTKALAGGGW